MATLDLQVRLRAIDQISRTFAQIRQQNGTLIRNFDRTREHLRTLNSQLNDIRALQRRRQQLANHGQELTRVQRRLQSLQQAMANTSAANRQSAAYQRLANLYDRLQNRAQHLNSARQQEQARVSALAQRLRDAGINTRNLAQEEQRLGQNASRTNAQIEEQIRRLQRLSERQQRMDAARARFQNTMALSGNLAMAGGSAMAVAYGGGQMLRKPIATFMEQENAAAALKSTMMTNTGDIGRFEEVAKLASELGAKYPGATADFMRTAAMLKWQGFTDDMVLNGGLEAASGLGTVLGLGFERSAEIAAKMMEAHGLKDHELPKAADYMQRMATAYGITDANIQDSQTYYAPNVRALGLTGAEHYKRIAAIQGMAAAQGLEGSPFGTSFSNFLQRTNKGVMMVELAKKDSTKAKARGIMESAGVKFNFYDKRGELKPLETIADELQTGIAKIQATRHGSKGAALVLREVFGEQGMRVAQILAEKGGSGIREAMAKIEKQASLDQRLGIVTDTLQAHIETLGAYADVALGSVGDVVKDDLKKLTDSASGFVNDTLQPWLNNNRELVRTLLYVGAGVVALSAVLGSIMLVLSPLISAFGALRYAMAFLLANPVAGAIAGIAALIAIGYQLYQNWDSICQLMAGIWEGMGERLRGAWDSTCALLKGAWDSTCAAVQGVWDALWEGILAKVSGAIEGVVNKFQELKAKLGFGSDSPAVGNYDAKQTALAKSAILRKAGALGINGREYMRRFSNDPAVQALNRLEAGSQKLSKPAQASIQIEESRRPPVRALSRNHNTTNNITVEVKGDASPETARLVAATVRKELDSREREQRRRRDSALFDQSNLGYT